MKHALGAGPRQAGSSDCSPGPVSDPFQTLAILLRPHRRWLHLAWLAGLGAALATVGVAMAIAELVHQALLPAPKGSHWPCLGLALAAVITRYSLQTLRDWSGQQLAFAVRRDLRGQMLATAAQRGPMRLAHLGHSGAWASRYQEQVDALGGYFSRYLPARGLAILVPLTLLTAAFAVDWLAALLLLLAAPLIPVFMALIGMGSQQMHEAQQALQSRLAGHFLDRIRGLDLLRRSLALEATRLEVAAAADRYRRLSMRVLRVAFLSSAVMEFFSAVAIGLVAIYVGFALLGWLQFGPAEHMTLASGLYVLLLAPEYFQPLRQFAHSHHDRASAAAAVGSLRPLLSKGIDPMPAPSPPLTAAGQCLLRLENVSLRYDLDGPPALRGISLTVAPSEQIALVGPSGSGKSSLLALCAGFLAPQAGTIARADEARRFAWMGQQAHLFHGNVRDNLLLASGAETEDNALIQALAAAGLPVDDPRLPAGLDTPIGEGNRGLSGGQAQRVALARALLSSSRLWLLDEPTSALDAETAADLLARLLAHARRQRITVLWATHQASVHRRLDRVVRLEHGQLRENRSV